MTTMTTTEREAEVTNRNELALQGKYLSTTQRFAGSIGRSKASFQSWKKSASSRTRLWW